MLIATAAVTIALAAAVSSGATMTKEDTMLKTLLGAAALATLSIAIPAQAQVARNWWYCLAAPQGDGRLQADSYVSDVFYGEYTRSDVVAAFRSYLEPRFDGRYYSVECISTAREDYAADARQENVGRHLPRLSGRVVETVWTY